MRDILFSPTKDGMILPEIPIDDSNLVDSLIKYEGFIAHPKDIGDGKITLGSGLTDPKWHRLYRERENVWSEEDNRRAVTEEVAKRRKKLEQEVPNWNRIAPLTQQAFISYYYNYPFNRDNSPKMFKAFDEFNIPEAINQMDATSDDPKFRKGLEIRREKERQWARQGLQESRSQQKSSLMPEVLNKFKSSILDKVLPNGATSRWAEGGYLNSAWDSLSMREKAAMMRVAVQNGITNLKDIREKYNNFAEGGYTVGELVDAVYKNSPREEYLGEPAHHYDFTQSEEWADAHGYYPDARGHRDDRVKKPTHPSHPSKGTWNGDKFELTDLGMQNPNYTLFGLNDGGQDPQAVLTYQGGIVLPEITVTPKENYIFNPYDNIILHQKSEGGKIHIKPENRGKFTALKKRTGHSATWFKEHGTPAQRKMATFALNARHWKHDLGGHLFDGETELTQQMNNGALHYNDSMWRPLTLNQMIERGRQEQANTIDGGTPFRVTVTGKRKKEKPYRWATARTPQLTIGDTMKGIDAATGPLLHWMQPSQYVGAVRNAVNGKNPVVSMLEGNSGVISEEYAQEHPWLSTAFNLGTDIVALGGLSKIPMNKAVSAVERGAEKASTLFNSPLTGRWTQIGSREYRLNPNSLGASGVPLESRVTGNVTDNLLRWIGSPLNQKVNVSAKVYLNNRYSPEYQRMAKMLQDNGVDLSRISVSDLTKIINKRTQELQMSAPERYSVARPIADKHFSIADFVQDRSYPIGETNLTIGDDGTAFMENVVNYTRNAENPIKGVQERSLNSAINISNSIGGDGVVTGREYLYAPKQYHVVQKFHDRKLLEDMVGTHSNTNMVTDYRKKYKIYDDGSESPAFSMLDLARAGEKERKVLLTAPVWKLSTPTFNTPTKSILFDPAIIDNEGKMFVDWDNPNIFRSLGGYLYKKN